MLQTQQVTVELKYKEGSKPFTAMVVVTYERIKKETTVFSVIPMGWSEWSPVEEIIDEIDEESKQRIIEALDHI